VCYRISDEASSVTRREESDGSVLDPETEGIFNMNGQKQIWNSSQF
jgi:hypothetical protein